MIGFVNIHLPHGLKSYGLRLCRFLTQMGFLSPFGTFRYGYQRVCFTITLTQRLILKPGIELSIQIGLSKRADKPARIPAAFWLG